MTAYSRAHQRALSRGRGREGRSSVDDFIVPGPIMPAEPDEHPVEEQVRHDTDNPSETIDFGGWPAALILPPD